MHGRRTAIRPRKIELHKPLPIHRSMDDVFFEDETGNMQRAAASGPVAVRGLLVLLQTALVRALRVYE